MLLRCDVDVLISFPILFVQLETDHEPNVFHFMPTMYWGTFGLILFPAHSSHFSVKYQSYEAKTHFCSQKVRWFC